MPVRSTKAKAKRAIYNRLYQRLHVKRLRRYRLLWARKRMSTPEGRVAQLLRGARRRAKVAGRKFAITLADLAPFPKKCPVLGIRLDYGPKKRAPGQDSPSIDRIDSSKGYIPGNVWIISWRANSLKNNGQLWEFEALVRAIKEKTNARR